MGDAFIFENASVGFCVFYVLLSVWKTIPFSLDERTEIIHERNKYEWGQSVKVCWELEKKIIRERKQNLVNSKLKSNSIGSFFAPFQFFLSFFFEIVCTKKKKKQHTHLFRLFYSSISVEFGRFWLVGFCFTSHWGMLSSSNNDNETGRNKKSKMKFGRVDLLGATLTQ